MTTEETAARFGQACAYYNEAKEIVKTLTEITKQAVPDFSFETAMAAYDLILQSALLTAAMEDGYYVAAEAAFIEKITDYGDLLAYINKRAKTNFTWANIASHNPEDRKTLALNFATVIAGEVADQFVPVFAIADKVYDEYEFGEMLLKKLRLIVMTLCVIDGDDLNGATVKNEFCAGNSVLEVLIAKKWNQIKNS